MKKEIANDIVLIAAIVAVAGCTTLMFGQLFAEMLGNTRFAIIESYGASAVAFGIMATGVISAVRGWMSGANLAQAKAE